MKKFNVIMLLFISIFVFVSCNNDDNESFTKSIVRSAASSPNMVIATYNSRTDTLIYNFDVDRVSNLVERESARLNNKNVVIEAINVVDVDNTDINSPSYIKVSYFDIDSAVSITFVSNLDKTITEYGKTTYYAKSNYKITVTCKGDQKCTDGCDVDITTNPPRCTPCQNSEGKCEKISTATEKDEGVLFKSVLDLFSLIVKVITSL